MMRHRTAAWETTTVGTNEPFKCAQYSFKKVDFFVSGLICTFILMKVNSCGGGGRLEVMEDVDVWNF